MLNFHCILIEKTRFCVTVSSSSVPAAIDLPTPDALDLQVEYWTVTPRMEPAVEKTEKAARKEMKCSLKMSLHSFRVFRGPAAPASSSASDPASLLSMVIVTPEKKQKSMHSWSLTL